MKNKLLNNIGLKILALVAAVIIWVLVVSVNDPVSNKTYRDVDVEILNEDVVTSEGKTYQVENGSKVSVTVRAQRSVLSRLDAKDIVVTADMKEMTLSRMIPTNVSIAKYEGRYQRAVTNPINVQVSIEDIVTNKFPITVTTSGSLRDGYALAGTEVDPETVTITGPESVINSIDHAVAQVSLTGISSDTTIQSDLVLYDANDKEIDQSRLTNNIGDEGISVQVTVHPTKDVPITVEEDQIETPSGYYLADVSYEPTKIEVSAEKSIMEDLEQIVVPASAFNLSEVKDKAEVTLEIGKYLPEGVELVAADEAKVVFTFSVAKLGEKIFDVPTGSIVVNNLSDKFQVEYEQTEDLQIAVRGPQSELDKLTLSKAVSIDLANYTQPGTFKVPVTVTLPEKCSAKEMEVTIKIKEK